MHRLTYIFLLFIPFTLSAQEICNNGIDDDGDLLIDLNDDECICEGLDGYSSLIQNQSFEDTLCCPETVSQLDCAENWIQASEATSDYYNLCGYTHIVYMTPPEVPLPGDGSGYVGFFEEAYAYHEMIGSCLSSSPCLQMLSTP
jgi:hypothetical protein